MQPPEFWHSPYPYRDFLVFSHRFASAQHHLARIEAEAARVGLAVASRKRHGKITSYVITRAVERQERGAKSLTFLSGIAQSGGTLYFGQGSVSHGDIGAQLGESIGIFTMLHANDRFVRVTQDFLGCGILYRHSSPDFIAVSNSYHLLLLFLSWIGYNGKLDTDKVAVSLFSSSTFFHQNVSRRMDIVGIEQIPFDHEVLIDRKGWRIVPKQEVATVLSGSDPRGFSELLQQGREEVLENVRAAIESECFTKVVTDLSGGMDSRAVFAAILNVNRARNRVEVRTRDVPGSRDLPIAAGLVKLFGATFYTESGRPQHPLRVADALDIWRSYFMGTYHRVGAPPWSPKGENLKELRLSGGCGEVYRTFWTKIYHKVIGDPGSNRDLATRLVHSCAPRPLQSSDISSRVVELLTHEFDNLPGMNPLDRLENHYLFYRNRYHFGMRAFETYHDSPMWFPLMSKALFAASRTLPSDARGNELVLQVTEQLLPLLVWIDYDSVDVPDNELLRIMPLSDKRLAGCRITLDESVEEWRKIHQQNTDALQRSRTRTETLFGQEWKELREYMRAEALRALDDLIEQVSETDDESLTALSSATRAFLDNTSLVPQYFSRLCSLRDQVAIFSQTQG